MVMERQEQKCYNYLNESYINIQKKYGEEHIFGIFYYNKKFVALILPTFEDVCINAEMVNNKSKCREAELDIFDIRYLCNPKKYGYGDLYNILFTQYYIINPKYEYLYQKLYKENKEQIKKGIKMEEPSQEIKDGLTKMLRTCFNDNSSVVKFIKQLTDIEKTAIEQIIAAVGNEGTFSQAKVASAAGISRAVMTNLIMKMQLAGVAEIKYFGNKGTYFKIIDNTLFDIRGKTY